MASITVYNHGPTDLCLTVEWPEPNVKTGHIGMSETITPGNFRIIKFGVGAIIRVEDTGDANVHAGLDGIKHEVIDVR